MDTTIAIPSAATRSNEAGEWRADIQVLRGWAVLVVLLHHAQLLPAGAAGYLGVDIFFVISGFVITTLITRDIDRGRFSLTGFYARRARRLLPAAYLTLLLTVVAAPFFLLNEELRDLLWQSWGALTFTANVVLWRQTGYFESAAQFKPLLHMWSLAIEEQFYLVWPLVLLYLPRRLWRSAAFIGFAASLAICFALNHWKPGAAFYLMPARAWELALGCIGALAGANARLSLARYTFWPALAAVFALPLIHIDLPRPGLVELAACLATLVVLLQRHAVSAHRALVPVAKLGDMSYALYLVHWPIFSIAANASVGAMPAQARLFLAVLAVLVAAGVHITVENPIRRIQTSPRRALIAALIGALVVAAAGVASVQVAEPQVADSEFRKPNLGLSPACESGTLYLPRPECRHGETARVLLMGDSTAMHLADALAVSAEPGFVQATKTVCAPLLGVSTYQSGTDYDRQWAAGCLSFQDSLLKWLADQPQIEVVVLAGWFEQFMEFPLLTNGEAQVPATGTQARAVFAANRLSAMAARLHAMGKRVVIVDGLPSLPGVDTGRCLAMRRAGRRVWGAAPDCSIDRAAYEKDTATVRALIDRAAREADVPVLRPADAMCDASICRAEADGVPLYRDGGHLSYAGSRWLGARMRLMDRVWAQAR